MVFYDVSEGRGLGMNVLCLQSVIRQRALCSVRPITAAYPFSFPLSNAHVGSGCSLASLTVPSPPPGYHHSLPSSPYFSGPEGQRLSPPGTLSSEFLNRSSSGKVLLLVCNVAGCGEQAVR